MGSYFEEGIRARCEMRTDAFIEEVASFRSTTWLWASNSRNEVTFMKNKITISRGKFLLGVEPVEERAIVSCRWRAVALDEGVV